MTARNLRIEVPGAS